MIRRALTDSDAIIWTIERDPHLRSTIIAVLDLERPPDHGQFLARFARVTRLVPKLRSRVVAAGPGRMLPVWVTDDDVDLDFHIRFLRAADPSPRALLDLAERQAMRAFDAARPLWEVTVVEGLEDDAAAILVKIHHSLTDGLGAMQIAAHLVDAGPEAAALPDAESEPPSPGPAGATTLLREGARDRVGSAAGQARQAMSALAGALRAALVDPAGVVADAGALVRSTAELVAPVGAKRSPLFARGSSLSWRMDTMELSLRDLKAAANAHGGTLNDAFLAILAGGLKRYHDRLGAPLEQVRVTMPVNIRVGDDAEAGNRFTPVRFDLPVAIQDPVARMRAVGQVAAAKRNDPALALTDGLAGVLNLLPGTITTAVFGSMLKGVDVVASNVPGSPLPLWIAGAEVLRMTAFAPPAGAAMSVTLVSHVDSASVGVQVDPVAVDDLDLLMGCLKAAAAEVLETANNPSTPGEAPLLRPSSDRLTALDAVFLELESPTTPMHIAALALHDGEALRDEHGAIRLDDLRRTVEARLGRLPRLRQRLRLRPLGRPVWMDDPDFDIANHVRLVRLDGPGSHDDLLAATASLCMELLDRSRPLWEWVVIDGLDGGQVAILQKVHHAVIDGLAGVATLVVMLDAEPRLDVPEAPVWVPRPSVSAPGSVEGVANAVGAAAAVPVGVARAAASLVGSRDSGGSVLDTVGNLLRNLPRAAPSSINQPVGATRRLATLRVPLAEAKAVRAALGGTVNDVILAAVSAGLGALLTSRGEEVVGGTLTAMVPKAERASADPSDLGNRVTALFVPLPVDEPEALTRYAAVRAATKSAKAADVDDLGDRLVAWADAWPAPVLTAVARAVHRQGLVNLVVTNVPGPPLPLYVLGARMTEVCPVVPLAGNLDIGVAIFSYDGDLHLGFNADHDTMPDLDVLVQGVAAGFADLRALARA